MWQGMRRFPGDRRLGRPGDGARGGAVAQDIKQMKLTDKQVQGRPPR